VTDEQGYQVDGEQLLLVFGMHLLSNHPGATVVVEDEGSLAMEGAIDKAGGRVVRSGRTRQEMYRAMRETGAVLGGGPSGRFWFRNDGPIADALMALTLMLTVLSQSDQPLSEVIKGVTRDWQ